MKKVLLIYKNEGLSQVFEQQLKLSGYETTSLVIHPIKWNDFTIFEKISNVFRRLVYKDFGYIHYLHNKVFDRHCKKRIKEVIKKEKCFDYCFVIHGGMISEEVLQRARKVSKRMIDYQPDGIGPNDKILNYRKLFDDIYVFDKNDIEKYPKQNFKLSNNFYIYKEPKEESYDMFYIGAKADNRQSILENLHKNFLKLNNKFILGISIWDSPPSYDNGIEYIKRHISYDDNIDWVLQSKILIDIKRPTHDGLSFRFFEAIGYDKKIITNNPTVKDFEFYHPNNIFVTKNFEDYEAINAFIQKPMVPYSQEYKDKYLFQNWIREIFLDYEK